MTDRTEQMVTAAALLGVVCAFVLGVHLPCRRALRDLHGQIQVQQRHLADAQQRCAVLTPLMVQVQSLRAAAGAFEAHLPADGQVGGFLRQLADHLRQAQLSSLEVRPASPVPYPHYTELPIRLGFEGTFTNLFAFLGRLEALPRTKRIGEINLVGDPVSGGPVRADMVLSIFCTKG